MQTIMDVKGSAGMLTCTERKSVLALFVLPLWRKLRQTPWLQFLGRLRLTHFQPSESQGVAQVGDKMVSNSAQGRKKNQVQLSLVYLLILADLAVTQQISQDFRRLGGRMNSAVTGMRLDRDWSLIVFLISCSSLCIKNRETNENQTFISVSHLCQLACFLSGTCLHCLLISKNKPARENWLWFAAVYCRTGP